MGLPVQLSKSDLLVASRLQRGRQVLLAGAEIIQQLVERLDDQFSSAVDCLLDCRGRVVVTGIGKAGIIGRKLSASLTSTGTRSHFLHPAEAVHGDLGCIGNDDVVIVLSYSGETDEVIRLIPTLKSSAHCLIAITASSDSSLGKSADVVLELGYHAEACTMGLAPTTTTTGMLALCDALTITVCEERGFTRESFARLHPAGNLGRQLMSVCEAMRPLIDCRVASDQLTVRQVMVRVSRPGRRTGAVMLVDSSGKLSGIFTDSDLARLLERCEDGRLDSPIFEVMTKRFQTISQHCRLPQATELMATKKISELPVVDDSYCPLGILDLTDLVGIVAAAEWTKVPASPSESESETVESVEGEITSPSLPSDQSMGPRIIPISSNQQRYRKQF
jgi:arabinose-5-phosphate isomerase